MFLDIPDGTSLEFDYNSETFTGPADSIYGSFTEMKAKIFLWKCKYFFFKNEKVVFPNAN